MWSENSTSVDLIDATYLIDILLDLVCQGRSAPTIFSADSWYEAFLEPSAKTDLGQARVYEELQINTFSVGKTPGLIVRVVCFDRWLATIGDNCGIKLALGHTLVKFNRHDEAELI